jgi:hypothetical protein
MRVRDSYVQLDNSQSVSKARFVKYVGALDAATMRSVGRRAILALGLEDCLWAFLSARPTSFAKRCDP